MDYIIDTNDKCLSLSKFNLLFFTFYLLHEVILANFTWVCFDFFFTEFGSILLFFFLSQSHGENLVNWQEMLGV